MAAGFQGDAFQLGAFQLEVPGNSPRALDDAAAGVDGNIGLRGDAKLFLPLQEPSGVRPSDVAGNLADFAAPTGLNTPPVVTSWSGRARQFSQASPSGLIAETLSGRDTLLQRDVTVQVLASLTLAGATGPQTIIARGLNDGTVSERYAFGLEVEEIVDSDNTVAVRWFWQDSTGAIRTQFGGEWLHVGDGRVFLLTATRRWESSTKVVVRYYLDERLLLEVTSTDGDISGGTTGRTTIGTRATNGVYGRHLNGTIDQLFVTDHEMSAEEVRAVWRRLVEHQPAGVEMFTGLIPPGAPWYRDPSNRIGRRMKVVGQGLGLAIASIDELREMWLPDRAPKVHIGRWEKLAGISPRPRDSLDLRRQRMLGLLGREEGFSHPAVKLALMESLAVANPDDLEIIEGTNIVLDDFDVIHDEQWLRGDVGTWSVVAGAARVTVPIATDIRWESIRWGAHMRTSLDTGGVGPDFVAAKLVTWSLPVSSGAGLLLADRRTNQGVWFGTYNDGGVTRLVYRFATQGVASAPVDTGAVGAAPFYLRIYRVAGMAAGEYRFAWSSTSPDTGFAYVTVATGIADPDWAGFGVFGASSSLAAQLTMDVDDFHAFCPAGVRPHHWYVYRNPALPGSPDLVGANALIQRLKPAHTHAAAIMSKSLLAGHERDGLVGRGPMGVVR